MLHAAQALNGFTALGVLVSALVGLFIFLTFRSQLAEFKLQRAVRLVDDFFSEKLDGMMTPSEALRLGFVPVPAQAPPAGAHVHLQQQIQQSKDRYAILDAYFQKALFLYERDMINREYFMGRMVRAILHASDHMKKFEPLIGSTLPAKKAVQELRPFAETYAKANGLMQ